MSFSPLRLLSLLCAFTQAAVWHSSSPFYPAMLTSDVVLHLLPSTVRFLGEVLFCGPTHSTELGRGQRSRLQGFDARDRGSLQMQRLRAIRCPQVSALPALFLHPFSVVTLTGPFLPVFLAQSLPCLLHTIDSVLLLYPCACRKSLVPSHCPS